MQESAESKTFSHRLRRFQMENRSLAFALWSLSVSGSPPNAFLEDPSRYRPQDEQINYKDQRSKAKDRFSIWNLRNLWIDLEDLYKTVDRGLEVQLLSD